MWEGAVPPSSIKQAVSPPYKLKTEMFIADNKAYKITAKVLYTAPPGPSLCQGFMITLRHTTFDMSPLVRRSAHCRDLYLTTHNAHKRQTSVPPVGFDPAIAS